MLRLFAIVITLTFSYGSTAQFVQPVSEETCEVCCSLAAASGGLDFDVSSCANEGCNRVADIAAQECDELIAAEQVNELAGCELGRDFRFVGVTTLLTADESLTQCNQDATLEEVTFEAPADLGIIRDSATCLLCCDNVNSAVDLGSDGIDDFSAANCEDSCVNELACFDEDTHRRRMGCLVALDFLTKAVTTLQDQIFTCELDGNFVQSAPTNFPTNVDDEDIEDAEEVEDFDDYILVLVGSGVASGLIFSACFFVVRSHKRQTPTKAVPETAFPLPRFGSQKAGPPMSTFSQFSRQSRQIPSVSEIGQSSPETLYTNRTNTLADYRLTGSVHF